MEVTKKVFCLVITLVVMPSFATTAFPPEKEGLPDLAEVTFVSASQQYDGSWCFKTTVTHNDEGWQHYANSWQVSDSTGNVL